MKIEAEYYWYHNDHLGTPQKMSTTSGAVVWSAKYSSFGKAAVDSGSNVVNPLRLPGQYEDAETGLHYNYYRYYNPTNGAYSREDEFDYFLVKYSASIIIKSLNINTVLSYSSEELLNSIANKIIEDHYLRSPEDSHPFNYAQNNPVNYIDPFGLWWEYSQSTGNLRHHTSPLGVTDVGTGYSGNGLGYNNPAMQNVPFVGPIPQGYYDIGPQHNSPNTGIGVMDLTPWVSTNTFGRNNFQIHGDNACGCNSASQGCIVLGPQVRNQIANSGDTLIRVIK